VAVASEKTDLNEFVGKYTYSRDVLSCLWALANLDYRRLVQDLCCQEVRVAASTGRRNGKGDPVGDLRDNLCSQATLVVKTREHLPDAINMVTV
jgi:hypothetical protein